MPNALGNQWGEGASQNFISKKINQFDQKLGELINLIFWFCVNGCFFNLGDSFHGNKENSFFGVTIATNQKKIATSSQLVKNSIYENQSAGVSLKLLLD